MSEAAITGPADIRSPVPARVGTVNRQPPGRQVAVLLLAGRSGLGGPDGVQHD